MSTNHSNLRGYRWKRQPCPHCGKDVSVNMRLLSEGRVAPIRVPHSNGGCKWSGGSGLDAVKVKPGDRVVFAHQRVGRPMCVEAARVAELKVGQEFSVAEVGSDVHKLPPYSCLLRLEGVSGWFNMVQFEEA